LKNQKKRAFFGRERKKETITGDIPSIIHCHVPRHRKNDIMMLPKTQRKNKFGCQMTSQMPPTCKFVMSMRQQLCHINYFKVFEKN
jgi:hypothetical protein